MLGCFIFLLQCTRHSTSSVKAYHQKHISHNFIQLFFSSSTMSSPTKKTTSTISTEVPVPHSQQPVEEAQSSGSVITRMPCKWGGSRGTRRSRRRRQIEYQRGFSFMILTREARNECMGGTNSLVLWDTVLILIR